nr:RNA-dependent RNA polymerase [Phlebiopsis gigantea fusarivirus 1]
MFSPKCLGFELRGQYLFEAGLSLGSPGSIPVPKLRSCGRVRKSKLHRNLPSLNPLPGASVAWDESVDATLARWADERRSSTLPSYEGVGFLPLVRRHLVSWRRSRTKMEVWMLGYKLTKDGPVSFSEVVELFAYFWSLSQEDRNKKVHALNGNILFYGFFVPILCQFFLPVPPASVVWLTYLAGSFVPSITSDHLCNEIACWTLYFVTQRPLFYGVRLVVAWIGSNTSYWQVYRFLHALLGLLDIGLWVSGIFGLVAFHASYPWLVYYSGPFWGTLVALILGPVLVIVDSMLLALFVRFFVFLFTGIWYEGNTFRFLQHFTLSVLWVVAKSFVLAIPHFLTSVIVLLRVLVVFPFDIVSLILNDRLLLDGRFNFRFFWTRVFLGVDLVLIYALNLTGLLWVMIAFCIIFFISLCGVFSILYPDAKIAMVLVPIVQQVFVPYPALRAWVANFMDVGFKRRVLDVYFLNYFGPSVVVADSDGRPTRFGPGSNPERMSDHIVTILYRRLVLVSRVRLTYIVPTLICLVIIRSFFKYTYKVGRTLLFVPVYLLNCFILFMLPFVLPDYMFELVTFLFSLFIGFLRDPEFQVMPRLRRVSSLLSADLARRIGPPTAFLDATGTNLRGGGLFSDRLNQLFVLSYVNMTRRSVLRVVEYLDGIRLPEMVQAAYNPPDLDSVRSTYVTLQDMGFPVDQTFIDSLERPEGSAYLAEWGSWKRWFFGQSNFALGYRNVKVALHSWLAPDFFPDIPGYIHSTQFTGIVEEITSTARYWTGNELDQLPTDDFGLDELVEDVWEGVRAQYGHSRLTSFNDIYRKWTKKFNMGFGFGTARKGKLYQKTRQSVIDAMGGKKPFLKAWEKVFYNAQRMVMPSPVFTKWESLKLKKALSRSVRTVVGSAFTHHVMTTVFNYQPNHNYHPWETPSKVGMPINGQNYNRLWESLLRHTNVWAGDMTAFDSSQAPVILAVCAEIRKKGYSMHRDYDRICQLIDISYEMLRDQPLGFKNFGSIAHKSQGATTGHSSTTPDNTMMLLTNYLYAWRRVTGLRAREFFNFNTLCNFGDDHVLGYDKVYGWTPDAAVKAMAELGTRMRDEAPGIHRMPTLGPLPSGLKDWRLSPFSFLAKIPLPLTPDVRSELAAAGIDCPLTFATCHDRGRLIGKAKGQLTKAKANNVRSSYEALLSYMYMTAHHKDVYDMFAQQASAMYLRVKQDVTRRGSTVKLSSIQRPPSYNQVLRLWYSSEPFPYKDDDLTETDEELDLLYMIESPDTFGLFIRWISDFPTLLSPRYQNIRWADWIQSKMAKYLSWPLSFVAASNGCALDLAVARLHLSRTPYSFLRNEAIVNYDASPEAFSRNIVRHWLYIAASRIFQRRKGFTPLDLVRPFDHLWINFWFALTGHVSQVAVELDLHVFDTLVVFLLSFVHIPLPIPLFLVTFPAPSVLIARLITNLLRMFVPSGSIDYQPLDEQIRHLLCDGQASFVLSAPTGVGKSTRMVNRISSLVGGTVIVIVPRQAVAVNVGTYMQQLYPNSGIGIACEGHKPNPGDRIVYTTVQTFFLSPNLRDPRNIFFLDEAHIDEPHYQVVRNFFSNPILRKIYVTATPLPNWTLPLLEIPAVNAFNITSADATVANWNNYIDLVVGLANDRASSDKTLIFIPTLSMMDVIASRLRHSVCRISSRHKHVDFGASVFISTSVADAGLTVPDVSLVITPELDIGVSELLDPGEDKKVRTYFFRLSDQTIRQRKGRTGRTVDGTCLIVHLTDVACSDRSFTFMDYMNGLAPCTQFSFEYFPQHILESLQDGWQFICRTFDLSPRSYGSMLRKVVGNTEVEIHNGAAQAVGQRVADRAASFGSIQAYWDNYHRSVVNFGPAKRQPNPDPDSLPVESWFGSGVPEDAVPIQPPRGLSVPKALSEAMDAPPESRPKRNHFGGPLDFSERHTRINVSGERLYCAARCMVGLVYTHLHVHFTTQLMVELLREEDPELDDEFDFYTVRSVLWDRFRILVSLEHHIDGRIDIVPIPQELTVFIGQPGISTGLLYLQNRHFNYHGIPVAGIATDHRAPQVIKTYVNYFELCAQFGVQPIQGEQH